jgi:preprotein translocase subunit SecF
MEFFKPGRRFNFMAQRKFWISLSIFIVIAATVMLFKPGLNYGTDFRGGTEVEVGLLKTVNVLQMRKAVEEIGFHAPDVVQVRDFNNPNHFLIRVSDVTAINEPAKEQLKKALCLTDDPKAAMDEIACPPNARATEVKFSLGGDKVHARYDTEPNLEKLKEQIATVHGVTLRATPTNPQITNPRDHRVEIQLQSKGDQLITGLRSKLGADIVPEQALRIEWVGPKAGKQLRDSARNAIAIAILFIMLYIAFRFDMRFAPGVVLACVHDAMFVIGAFALLQKEFTLTTIAAVLTIVGYSMNDTVVVFDRIRENLSKHRGKSFYDIINLSVSETLSRTILTSGATMLSVLPLLVFGTGVIKDFAFAMVIGIVAGTYSSIYVAAPLTEYIDRRVRGSSPSRARPPVSAAAKA